MKTDKRKSTKNTTANKAKEQNSSAEAIVTEKSDLDTVVAAADAAGISYGKYVAFRLPRRVRKN